MMGGGGGMLSLLFWGAFAVIMLQVVQGVWRNQMGTRAGLGCPTAHHACCTTLPRRPSTRHPHPPSRASTPPSTHMPWACHRRRH